MKNTNARIAAISLSLLLAAGALNGCSGSEVASETGVLSESETESISQEETQAESQEETDSRTVLDS